MMEQLGLHYVLGPALGLGIPGIVLILWYFGDKARERDLKAYREDTGKILAAYQDDMKTMRAMYEANVVLVKQYGSLCTDLKDLIIWNTTQMQGMRSSIDTNLFCPLQRVKKAAGVPE